MVLDVTTLMQYAVQLFHDEGPTEHVDRQQAEKTPEHTPHVDVIQPQDDI